MGAEWIQNLHGSLGCQTYIFLLLPQSKTQLSFMSGFSQRRNQLELLSLAVVTEWPLFCTPWELENERGPWRLQINCKQWEEGVSKERTLLAARPSLQKYEVPTHSCKDGLQPNNTIFSRAYLFASGVCYKGPARVTWCTTTQWLWPAWWTRNV